MKPALRPALAALALCAGALAALARSPEPPLARDEISAVQLAEWLREQRPNLAVIDTRPDAARRRDGLPGARSVAEFDGDPRATVVLYGERSLDSAPALRRNPRAALRLHGGVEAWNRQVLFPTLRADASARQAREFAARARLSRYFGGAPRVLDPGAQPRHQRSRRGC